MTSRASATGPAEPGGVAGTGREHDAATSAASTSAGVAVWGSTRTRTPRRRSDRTMFALSPKSTIATSGSPASSPTSRTAAGDTWATKSWSSQRGTARARSTAASWSVTPGSVMTPAQAAVRAQVAGEGARVDAGDGRDVVAAQQRRELARVVEDRGRRVGDDEPAEPRPFGLVVVAQPAVVADQRVGHDDDLAGVRGIGGDLLVAGLRGVDDEVAARGDRGAERDAREHRPVLEREERGTGVADAGIDDRIGAGQRRMRNGRWGDHGIPAWRAGGATGRGERAPRAGMRTRIWPPTRPLRTGRPASQDRRSGCPDDSTWAGRRSRPSGRATGRSTTGSRPRRYEGMSDRGRRLGRPAPPRSSTRNTAPLGARLATPIRPPWRSTIQLAIASPRPVPPDGAPGARQKRSKTCAMSSSRMPGPWSATSIVATGRRRRTDDRHRAAARAVADGVVDEDRDQLAQARRVADDHRRLRVDAGRARRAPPPSGRAPRRPSNADVAQVERHPLERDRAGVGAGEQQQVVDHAR